MRLTVASTWGLGVQAVESIKEQLRCDIEHLQLKCEDDYGDHLLLIQGSQIVDSLAEVGAIYAGYIEDQKGTDLREGASIFRLCLDEDPASVDLPGVDAHSSDDDNAGFYSSIHSPGTSQAPTLANSGCSHVQYWSPVHGGIVGVGLISKHLFGQVSFLTCTVIDIDDETNNVRVSGDHSSAIGSALRKLNNLDQCLLLVNKMTIFNMLKCPNAKEVDFQFKKLGGAGHFSDLGAFANISPISTKLEEHLVTALRFPKKTPSTNKASDICIVSQVWKEFRFPGMGNRDGYHHLRETPMRENAEYISQVEDMGSVESTGACRVPSDRESVETNPSTSALTQSTMTSEDSQYEQSKVSGVKKRRAALPPSTGEAVRIPPVTKDFECQVEALSSTKTPMRIPSKTHAQSLDYLADLPDHGGFGNCIVQPEVGLCLAPAEVSPLLDVSFPEACSFHISEGISSFNQNPLKPSRLRSHRDTAQSDCEVTSRTFKRLMSQRAGKSQGNMYRKTKTQAASSQGWDLLPRKSKAKAGSKGQEISKISNERDAEIDIEKVYRALQPTLEAARSFPGPLSFEIHIGLILISHLGRNYQGDWMTKQKWNEIFDPNNDLPSPTTKFYSQITFSGADIDQLLTLKKGGEAADDGDDLMFDQQSPNKKVTYEFDFHSKDGQRVVIVIDHQRKVHVNMLTKTLAALNIHFPENTWDAMGRLKGAMKQVSGVDEELDSAILHFKDSIWIPPEQEVINMFVRLPSGGELRLDEVRMKRSASYRYLRSESEINTLVADDMHSGDIFLKITEVQVLGLQPHPQDPAVTCVFGQPPPQMMKNGHLWYEASIVSQSVEEALLTNARLEIGEITNEWSTDSLDKNDRPRTSAFDAANSAEVQFTKKIGRSDISEMFHVAQMLVERIDAVGQCQSRSRASVDLKNPKTGSVIHRATVSTAIKDSVDNQVDFW